MNQEQMLVKALLCCLVKVGGSLDITTHLFDNIGNYQIVFGRNDETGIISLSYRATEVIIGTVDNDVVTVS